MILADKAFDADERVIQPLQQAGKVIVIPPKANRTIPRATTNGLLTSSARSISPLHSRGLIDDTP